MIFRMNLEIETDEMTLLEFGAVVDRIQYASGVRGRVRCTPRLNPAALDVELAQILTERAGR